MRPRDEIERAMTALHKAVHEVMDAGANPDEVASTVAAYSALAWVLELRHGNAGQGTYNVQEFVSGLIETEHETWH